MNNLVRAILEARDGSLWFGAYPYAVGAGGISVGRYKEMKSLTDRVLDLLPEPPPSGSSRQGNQNKEQNDRGVRMPGLIIDDHLVTTLTTEVAPLVSRVTGWDLNIATLHSRVLAQVSAAAKKDGIDGLFDRMAGV